MKTKNIKIDETKYIETYDNVLAFSDQAYLYDYVKSCAYRLNRTASTSVPMDKQFKTLLSEFNIFDLIKLQFFKNIDKEILERIKENEYRLHRAYVNLSTAQDVYHYHVDSDIDDDFTILMYCNTYWEENWEGETHFGNEQGNEIVHSTSFKPNRLVLFSGTIPHKSSQPSFFAKDFRYVLTLKFTHPKHKKYSEDFPIGDMILLKNAKPTHNEKEAISFLQRVTQNIAHSDTTLFAHLYNTWNILKNQNRSEQVCMAGLFHSVYGTEFYDRIKLDREEIQKIIGQVAENIVFRFCNLQDRDAQLLHPQSFDKDLIQIAYANVLEEKFRNLSHESEIIAYKNKLIEIKAH